MIKKFDRATCRLIGEQAVSELQEWATKHGITVRKAGGRWSPDEYNMKLTFNVKNAQGEVQTNAMRDFKQLAPMYGLKESDFHETFSSRGTTYRIMGLKARAYKYPIQVERVSDKKGFKFPAEIVKRCLNGSPNSN